eukprot:COSAG01_NODE_27500_length_684_cov_1.054701_1_plen_94_part_10
MAHRGRRLPPTGESKRRLAITTAPSQRRRRLWRCAVKSHTHHHHLRVSQSTFIWVNPDSTTLLYNGMAMYQYNLGKPFANFAKADTVHASTNEV